MSHNRTSGAHDDIAVLNALAAAYAGFGQFDTAFTLLDMSTHLMSANPETHRIRAVVAMQAGLQDQALASVDALEDITHIDDDMMRLRNHALALQADI